MSNDDRHDTASQIVVSPAAKGFLYLRAPGLYTERLMSDRLRTSYEHISDAGRLALREYNTVLY